MILALDIGNSNIVLGCLDDEKIYFVSRIATELHLTADQYAVQIAGLMTMHDVNKGDIDGCIISSVVPPLSGILATALRRLIGINAMQVGPGIKTGVNILIDNPAQAGADLVVASVAVAAEYPLPAVVIDMGTATTVSALDKNGSFLGTVIYPGARISLEALSRGTAQLPAISLDAPKKAVGTNTVDSMRSGIVFGTCDMIDGMIDRFEKEMGPVSSIVATGGLAPLILGHCRHEIIHDKNLMLKGLLVLYNRNKKQ